MTGAATVRQWADDIRRFAQDWPNDGAEVVSRVIEDVLASDTGGDGRLSHYKGGSAEVDIEEGVGEAEVSAGGAMGLWVMLEHGTSAHRIHAASRSFLRTPYGPRRMVQVSGMTASQTWSKGAAGGLIAAARDAEVAWGKVTR